MSIYCLGIIVWDDGREAVKPCLNTSSVVGYTVEWAGMWTIKKKTKKRA